MPAVGTQSRGKDVSSLKDVARRAQVAVSTASLALNNKARVSDETRRRVLEAAQELNYYPHAIARSLKTRKTDTIGLFMVGVAGPVHSEVVQGVHDALASHGLDTFVCFSHNVDRFLKGKQIDGAIVLDAFISDETIRQIARRGAPVVVMDRIIEQDGIHSVLVDNRQGMSGIVAHVRFCGYRRIVYLTGPRESFDGVERELAFRELIGDDVSVRLVSTDMTEEGGLHAVHEVLSTGPLPDVFVCANDEVAIGALTALEARDLTVPEDVGLTGFDDIELARRVTPRLTTARVQHRVWAHEVAETLIASLEGKTVERVKRMDAALIVGDSTSTAAEAAAGALGVARG